MTMETVVFKSPFAESEDARTPELLDTAKYAAEVLSLPSGISEDNLDQELLAKAHSLGIAASALEKQGTFSSASSTIWSNLGDRSVSSTASSANITPHSSICGPPSPLLVSEEKTKEPRFAPYERYLAIVEAQLRTKFRQGSLPALGSSSLSVFSVSTKKSFSSVNNAKSRKWWQKKPIHGMDPSTSCLGCRATISKSLLLHGLDCNHAYCTECLRFLVSQAMVAEANMPPRCCAQAIPSSTLETVLDRSTTARFLDLVNQYSTPITSRIYCPSEACSKFIAVSQTIDPKHPFDATCSSCRTRVCVGCKQEAHPIGKPCDNDWELEALVKIGQKPAWKRCYKCQDLAGLTPGEDRIACRCGAEMCHDCGAVWDSTTGCPNLCGDEGEIARRRQSEERTSHEGPAAIHRSAKPEHTTEEIRNLGRSQNEELSRFCTFLHQSQSSMRVRHSTEKLAVLEKHAGQQEELREQHTKDVSSLEDRQVAAEIELRNTLEQSERSVRLRLKHMEAYCKDQSRVPSDAMPSRVVTEKDLDQLEQQYALLQGMEQQHQTKINVMRERQTKRMEELVTKQQDERVSLNKQHADEIAEQDMRFAAEVRGIEELFRLRQIRMNSRWALQMEVLSKDQTTRSGVTCAPLPTPVWPRIDGSDKLGVSY